MLTLGDRRLGAGPRTSQPAYSVPGRNAACVLSNLRVISSATHPCAVAACRVAPSGDWRLVVIDFAIPCYRIHYALVSLENSR